MTPKDRRRLNSLALDTATESELERIAAGTGERSRAARAVLLERARYWARVAAGDLRRAVETSLTKEL